MAHPNEDIFRKGYEAFQKGDMEALGTLFTDDTVWHSPGKNIIAGDYKGKEQVFGLFAKLAQETEGSFQIELHDLLANDEHGVALFTTRANRGDKHLESNGVHVAHFQGGKLAESWLHSVDQNAVDGFWS
jgi:ketosteroid isomerase-like protein